MRYMTAMEMLEMHCIFFLEGLREMGVSSKPHPGGSGHPPRAPPQPLLHSLLQLRVDGQHLGVAHEGEGHDGDGVGCLRGGGWLSAGHGQLAPGPGPPRRSPQKPLPGS